MKRLFAILLAILGFGNAAATETPKVPPAEMSGDLRTMVFNLSAAAFHWSRAADGG